MREIKFRGKAVNPEELDDLDIPHEIGWVYGNLITNNGRPYIVGNVVESCDEYIALEYWVRVDPKTVGQYTGLKDKNGKEIYEKDVVDFDGEKYMVTFANGAFGIWKEMRTNLYSDETRNYHEPLWNLVLDGCEVIGNIFQNGEM